MSWLTLYKFAREEGAKFGHKIGQFNARRSTPNVRTAMCETCFGCCWVAITHEGKEQAGGRLLKYRCGTHEAAGTLPIVHGESCRKVVHDKPGFLHDAVDDGPYDIDGVNYCGRCHVAL